MRRRRKAMVQAAVATATSIAAIQPAAAHDPPHRWSTHIPLLAKAGVCSQPTNATGGAVRFWQSILWAGGHFYGSASVDGDFGQATHDATKAWQKNHGLTQDGCVGSGSLSTAQNYTGHGGHMDFLGTEYVPGDWGPSRQDHWKYQDDYHDPNRNNELRTFEIIHASHCGNVWFQRPNTTTNTWYGAYSHNC